MAKRFANSDNPDQTPLKAASDLGLQCLPVTVLGLKTKIGYQEWTHFKEEKL